MFNSSTLLPPALERLVQRFQQTSDPKRRYEHLLWLAKRLPEFPAAAKIATNKVPGCVSQVYITAALEDGKVTFQGDSDAQIIKGLVALLIEGLSGLSPHMVFIGRNVNAESIKTQLIECLALAI